MQHDFILLDRSGSMADLWVEAISSINSYVHKLATNNVDTGVTLVAFDSELNSLDFEIIRDRIIPSTWKDVGVKEVEPRGTTPLSDATAKIVGLANAGGYEKVAIIIMTDGHENASTEFPGHAGVEKVKKMLADCTAKGWSVIFMGANFDNAAQATSYGVQSSNTVQSSTRNMGATMNLMATKRGAYGSGQSATMEFSADEKTLLKQD